MHGNSHGDQQTGDSNEHHQCVLPNKSVLKLSKHLSKPLRKHTDTVHGAVYDAGISTLPRCFTKVASALDHRRNHRSVVAKLVSGQLSEGIPLGLVPAFL